MDDQAILLPQRALLRDAKGNPTTYVVNAENKVEIRPLKVGRTQGNSWVVLDGLKAGDKVIVEGLQKIRPGSPFALPNPPRSSRTRLLPRSGRGLFMARFFIDRPVFAWVIAIIIMLAGGISILNLPISQYPSIAPPTIGIRAQYPGASAQTVQDTVTQVIEQNMNGLDYLLYMSSTSDSSGQAEITLTFSADANPDIAQVQVQNKLQLATPLLPQEVQRQGISVAKRGANFLKVYAFVSEDGSMDNADIADYVATNLKDAISRISGVGEVSLFGSQYGMRIWLDPHKLQSYKLMPSDVINALNAQNAQVSAGQLGGTPSVPGQQMNLAISGAGAFADSGTVQQRHPAHQSRRFAYPREGRGPRGAWQRKLFHAEPLQRQARHRYRGEARHRRERVGNGEQHRQLSQGRRSLLPAGAEGRVSFRHYPGGGNLHP